MCAYRSDKQIGGPQSRAAISQTPSVNLLRPLARFASVFVLLASASGLARAEGPSFDCAKAATSVEKLICADAELSKLDSALAGTYSEKRRLLNDEGKEALLTDQRKWLRWRKMVCGIPAEVDLDSDWQSADDQACLRKLYKDRIEEVDRLTALGIGEEIAPLRHELMMSENDKLCNYVVSFYNNHTWDRDTDRKLIEDQYGKELYFPGPSFIIDESASGYFQFIPSIDIFNNGTARTIIIRDRYISSRYETRYTELLVFKQDADLESIRLSIDKDRREDIDFFVDFGRGGSSNQREFGRSSYTFKKPANKTITTLRMKGSIGPIPGIGQSVQRLIKYNNRNYILARNMFVESKRENIGDVVLLYEIEQSGEINEVCYSELRGHGYGDNR